MRAALASVPQFSGSEQRLQKKGRGHDDVDVREKGLRLEEKVEEEGGTSSMGQSAGQLTHKAHCRAVDSGKRGASGGGDRRRFNFGRKGF
jgi:hypothetical protein